jgi:hypothetical protein
MLQMLLDVEATLLNLTWKAPASPLKADLENLRARVITCILANRVNRPPCHGEDDCSSLCLSVCPWRIDCGEP